MAFNCPFMAWLALVIVPTKIAGTWWKCNKMQNQSYWKCLAVIVGVRSVNTLRPRQDGRHFSGDIFKSIFLNENIQISIKISLNCVPKGSINNIPALVQIMDWRRSGDKPLSEPMMVSLVTHICVTRPQWVNIYRGLFVHNIHSVLDTTICGRALGLNHTDQMQITILKCPCFYTGILIDAWGYTFTINVIICRILSISNNHIAERYTCHMSRYNAVKYKVTFLTALQLLGIT